LERLALCKTVRDNALSYGTVALFVARAQAADPCGLGDDLEVLLQPGEQAAERRCDGIVPAVQSTAASIA